MKFAQTDSRWAMVEDTNRVLADKYRDKDPNATTVRQGKKPRRDAVHVVDFEQKVMKAGEGAAGTSPHYNAG